MRTPGFDPRQTVVVAESEGPGLDKNGALVPLRSSWVGLSGQSLIFSGVSAPGRTIAVLPFRFSHCWQPSWEGTPGRVIRVDAALLGVVFDNAVRVRLSWTAGYGLRARCLSEDAALVPAAHGAGRGLR